MGNYRFRLSDMIPNAWFYKLKDMSSKPKNTKKKPTSTMTSTPPPQKSHLSQTTRYSYYFTTQPPNRADNNLCNSSPQHPKASDTHFPALPRRSSTRKSKRKAVYKPSPNKTAPTSSVINCNFHDTIDSPWTDGTNPIQYSPDYFGFSSESSSDEHADFHELIPSEFECDYFCGLSTFDTTFDMKDEGSTKKALDQKIQNFDEFDMISEMELPPILTKPMKFDEDHVLSNEATTTNFKRSSSNFKEVKGQRSLTVKIVKEESTRTQKVTRKQANSNRLLRKSSANLTGIRLRNNTPRVATKNRTQPCGRKSVSSLSSSPTSTFLKPKNRPLSESFAVAKNSVDPLRDFRESMVEMIVENNIRASKDLEDLLACYLALNSNEYHDLIVKAFEQIWFDMSNIKM